MSKTITSTIHYIGGAVTVDISDTSEGFFHRVNDNVAKLTGEWSGYEFISGIGNYAHCTEYFAGVLPTETLFAVKAYEATPAQQG